MDIRNPEETCSTREAALALGISVRTAQIWVEEGRLKAWKTPGGHRRILRTSVDEVLARRRAELAIPVHRFEILVVEDDPVQREMLKKHVEKDEAMKPEDIADSVVLILKLPRRTNLCEILIRPTTDVTPGVA